MKTAYQGTNHKEPKTDHLVKQVAKKVFDEGLHQFTKERPGNEKAKAVPNIISVGEAKLRSSSLATFNRKIRAMAEGRQYDEDYSESDLLPTVALNVNFDDDEGDNDILGGNTGE